MVCHKGTTRGINPAPGTANTRPLKDWSTEKLPVLQKKLI